MIPLYALELANVRNSSSRTAFVVVTHAESLLMLGVCQTAVNFFISWLLDASTSPLGRDEYPTANVLS